MFFSVVCLLFLGLFLAVPIAEIVIGMFNVEKTLLHVYISYIEPRFVVSSKLLLLLRVDIGYSRKFSLVAVLSTLSKFRYGRHSLSYIFQLLVTYQKYCNTYFICFRHVEVISENKSTLKIHSDILAGISRSKYHYPFTKDIY